MKPPEGFNQKPSPFKRNALEHFALGLTVVLAIFIFFSLIAIFFVSLFAGDWVIVSIYSIPIVVVLLWWLGRFLDKNF